MKHQWHSYEGMSNNSIALSICLSPLMAMKKEACERAFGSTVKIECVIHREAIIKLSAERRVTVKGKRQTFKVTEFITLTDQPWLRDEESAVDAIDEKLLLMHLDIRDKVLKFLEEQEASNAVD